MNGTLVGLGALLVASGLFIAAGQSVTPAASVLTVLAGLALALSAVSFTIATKRRREPQSI